MKCQNCGQNEANFFQRTNINGEVTESHLCTECAEKTGALTQAQFPSMFEHMFSERQLSPFSGFSPLSVFSPFIGFMPVLMSSGAVTATQPAAPAQQTTAAAVPVDEDMKKRREINLLREQMKRASEAEEFEKAISLREEIRRLES